MKTTLLSLALVPLFLAGCASSGYVGDYPNGGPGYYERGYYYSGPAVGVTYTNYGHGYHHYSNNSHRSYATSSHTTYHSSSHHASYASNGGNRTTTTTNRTARVSSTQVHH